MEENKPVKTGEGEALSEEQVASIAGGADCTTTTTAGTGGINSTVPGDPGTALTAIYEGFVDVTSHIIERVANVAK